MWTKECVFALFVDPGEIHMLAFNWRNHIYIDKTLPFGLRSAAYLCQRTTNMIRYLLKQRGVDIVNYIDDLGGADSPEKALFSYQVLRQTLKEIGVIENEKKACAPSTQMVFLGTLLDSEKMEIRITDDRMAEIRSLLPKWLLKKSATKRELQSLIGKLQFVGKCVKPSRIFISRVLVLLRGLKHANHKVRLNTEFKKDIQWWISFMHVYNGVSMIKTCDWSKVDQVLMTDSCLTGCGGICGDQFFHRQFSEFVTEAKPSIVHLECLTVMVAVKFWAKHWTGLKLTIYCDNEAVCSCIGSGRTKDPLLLNCLREICYFASLYEFQLRAFHLSSNANRLSDILSRWHLDSKYECTFFQESGLRPCNEIHIDDRLFNFDNCW